MKNTSKILKFTVIAVGLVSLLAVAASANRADQSIYFQHETMNQASDLGGGPTCGYFADSDMSIWFQNKVQPQAPKNEPLTLCSVTVQPSDSIWFRK